MSRVHGVPVLRNKKANELIEQQIALGHSHERIARDLGFTVEEVDRVRAEMDIINAADEPDNCSRCGEQVHVVSVHHTAGHTTLHRACPNGHRYRPTAPNGRRLSVVRGER